MACAVCLTLLSQAIPDRQEIQKKEQREKKLLQTLPIDKTRIEQQRGVSGPKHVHPLGHPRQDGEDGARKAGERRPEPALFFHTATLQEYMDDPAVGARTARAAAAFKSP
jgi:hypothetical protein